MIKWFFLIICFSILLPISSAQLSINSNVGESIPSEKFELQIYVWNNSDLITNPTCNIILSDFITKDYENYSSTSLNHTLQNMNKGEKTLIVSCWKDGQTGTLNQNIDVTTYGLNAADDRLTIFIYILFILTLTFVIYSFFMAILNIAIANQTIYGVLISWASFLSLLLTDYLARAYLLSYFIEGITGNIISWGGWVLVILPLIALFITMIKKGFDKKSIPKPQEFMGGPRW